MRRLHLLPRLVLRKSGTVGRVVEGMTFKWKVGTSRVRASRVAEVKHEVEHEAPMKGLANVACQVSSVFHALRSTPRNAAPSYQRN